MGIRETEIEEWTITLTAFFAGLEDLLGALCTHPGRWILIVEPRDRPHLFWQALAFEDGSLCTEVVSNTYLVGDQWTPNEEIRLLELGWEAPNPPKRSNWIHVETNTSPDVEVVVLRSKLTLRSVFGLSRDDEVLVKLFSSPFRGTTPASAQHPLKKP